MRLKPLNRQVMVITGATSGIGLVTARMAVQRGARVVLAARNESALRDLAGELGESAAYAVADVADEAQVHGIAEVALDRFGHFDTWVNDAGVSIYGNLIDLNMEDQRRLFDTNFWGLIHGCRVAIEHMQDRGGALINIGSVLSERSIPLQGIYCASKHAVKGYTETLRMELEKARIPISVTLIKPSAIDTPYKDHAKNYLDVKPQNPPPVYAPEAVARAILHCAQHPRRDVTIGGGGKMITVLEHFAPGAADFYMKTFLFDQQQTDIPAARHAADSLYTPSSGMEERGGYAGRVMESSIYTSAVLMNPLAATALAFAGGLLLSAFMRRAN
ncbi:MAG: SDR family oxidoreductase [Bryobacteraceae bacterium]|nr:SDR family oxidoreductase [Bryobacteraceae bacterium]